MWCQATISILSALIGGLIVIAGQLVQHHLDTKEASKRDQVRKALLTEMLNDHRFEWRKITTLSRVIGSSEEETARLLIDLGARGSERDANEGRWSWKSKYPIAETEE